MSGPVDGDFGHRHVSASQASSPHPSQQPFLGKPTKQGDSVNKNPSAILHPVSSMEKDQAPQGWPIGPQKLRKYEGWQWLSIFFDIIITFLPVLFICEYS